MTLQKRTHNKVFLDQKQYLKWKQCPLLFHYHYVEKRPYKTSQINTNKEIALFNEKQVREIFLQSFLEESSEVKIYKPSLIYNHANLEIIEEKINTTQIKIKNSHLLIFQALLFNGYAYAYADALEKTPNGWNLYLVKSSGGFNLQQKLEAAFLYTVTKDSGLIINNIFLVGVLSKYIKKERINAQELLKKETILDFCKNRSNEVKKDFFSILKLLLKKKLVAQEIGSHCKYPYPCVYKNFCWQKVPSHSIFELSGMNEILKFKIYKKYHTLDQLDKDAEFLTERQKLQVKSYQERREYVMKKELKLFLSQFIFPLYFIDFESFSTAVPIYTQTSPHESVPFQFSLHILQKDSSLEHKEFLFLDRENSGLNPYQEFAENLLLACEQKENQKNLASIIAYSAAFEKRITMRLAEKLPQKKEILELLYKRFIDLAIPFQNGYYYHPDMQGSFSLKKVLPVINSKMSYKKLSIQNGGEAMLAYLSLRQKKDSCEIKRISHNLLTYCALDSYAMVELYHFLKKATEL